jgi:hypothetical protein
MILVLSNHQFKLQLLCSFSAVIEIPSNASLADTVEILSKNKILSAPIRNVDAPEDASWIDKYIGIVEFAGIAMWLLYQVSHLNTRALLSSSLFLFQKNICLILCCIISCYICARC